MQENYPSHEGQLTRLKKIEGQISGIRTMIDEQRYCIDIINQIKAVTGALKQVQMGVLEKHIHHCVKDSMESGDPDYFEKKVVEIVHVLGRLE